MIGVRPTLLYFRLLAENPMSKRGWWEINLYEIVIKGKILIGMSYYGKYQEGTYLLAVTAG